MPGPDLDECGRGARLQPIGLGPGGRVGRPDRGHLGKVEPALQRGFRHRGEQRLRVGMLRLVDDRPLRPDLDEPAAAHHGDARGEIVDHREIVADEHVSEVQLASEVGEQVQDLGLHRDVERGDRLVQHQDVRPQCEGAGDPDALALPAGQRVRVAPQHPEVEPDELHQVAHVRVAALLRSNVVDDQRLLDDRVDRQPRRQRRERVLEHQRDAAAVGREVVAG